MIYTTKEGGLRLTNQFDNGLFKLESKLVVAEGQIVFSREKKDIFSPAADGGDPCIIQSDIALGECAADLERRPGRSVAISSMTVPCR